MVAEVAPLFHHEYVPPPDAVSVVVCPVQIFVLPLMDAAGCPVTVSVNGTILSQPPTVTVAVYTVVAVGETTIEGEVAPVLHAYAPPPVAVRVALFPAQMVDDGEADMLAEGFAQIMHTTVFTGVKEEVVAVKLLPLPDTCTVGVIVFVGGA